MKEPAHGAHRGQTPTWTQRSDGRGARSMTAGPGGLGGPSRAWSARPYACARRWRGPRVGMPPGSLPCRGAGGISGLVAVSTLSSSPCLASGLEAARPRDPSLPPDVDGGMAVGSGHPHVKLLSTWMCDCAPVPAGRVSAQAGLWPPLMAQQICPVVGQVL